MKRWEIRDSHGGYSADICHDPQPHHKHIHDQENMGKHSADSQMCPFAFSVEDTHINMILSCEVMTKITTDKATSHKKA